MKTLLKELLNNLESLAEENEEIFDTDCREQIHDVIFSGFVKPADDFKLPDEFGLFSEDGNSDLKKILGEFLKKANTLAEEQGITKFRDRLDAVQDVEVETDEGNTPDEFMGWIDPNDFDEEGNWIES